jgi:3-oxoacyl-[acyl-carrier-protein] synthase II
MMTQSNTTPLIALTGASAICALGTDRKAVLERMLSGGNGFTSGDGLEARPDDNPGVGQAMDLEDPVGCVADRAERYLRQAIDDAIDDAGCRDRISDRTAVVLGTTLGGIRHLGHGLRTGELPPYARLNNSAVSRHALEGTDLPLGGISLSAACASGLTAIINGALLLETGEADLVIAGGYDPISEFSLGGFMSLRLVAQERTRPFEADRIGMKVGEGYGVVVLERADDARARGASIIGWLGGSGECSDAYHLTQPQPEGEGAARALQAALELPSNPVPGWILAHGTATPANDGAEYAAYRKVLGAGLREIPVTALKSRLGHTLGAAGALELVLGLTALERDTMVTTADGITDVENFPDLDLLRGAPPARTTDRVAVLSLGFGGADACLAVDRGTPGGPTRTSNPDPIVFTGIGALLPGVGALSGPTTGDDLGTLSGTIDAAAFEGLDDPRATRRLARISCLARAAGRLAGDDAGLNPELLADSDALVGSFHGAVGYSLDYYRELVESGIEMGNPLLFAESVPNIGSAQCSLALGIRGATLTVAGSRTAAAEALHLARLRIMGGLAERVLVIGVEEEHQIITDVMGDGGLLARRDGSREEIGSGAICLVLERESSARARQAPIHARLVDTGVAWPRRSGTRERIRVGRTLLDRVGRSSITRTTGSHGPIGRIEDAIASNRARPDTPRCEVHALSILLPVLEAVSRGEQVAVIGSDFHGGSAVIAVEPC